MSKTATSYHHGDLRASLVASAQQMLQEQGIENLSLRKLADKVGVSRTAPYHHFKNKNELLCAIAEQGFHQLQGLQEQVFATPRPLPEQCREFVLTYLHFAHQHPPLYDLMFGRTIWQQQQATEALQQVAYPNFQYHLRLVSQWQKQGLLADSPDSLRLAQVIWATMHGIARLLIDGIYADASHLEEMCNVAVEMFLQGGKANKT